MQKSKKLINVLNNLMNYYEGNSVLVILFVAYLRRIQQKDGVGKKLVSILISGKMEFNCIQFHNNRILKIGAKKICQLPN